MKDDHLHRRKQTASHNCHASTPAVSSRKSRDAGTKTLLQFWSCNMLILAHWTCAKFLSLVQGCLRDISFKKSPIPHMSFISFFCVPGNLIYGEDIRRTLLNIPENRAQYILMERIGPASINKTHIVRQESMTPVDIISELGIFGIFNQVTKIQYSIDIRSHPPYPVKLDCSQPSIFSYFFSIVDHADRTARELDRSTKRTSCSLCSQTPFPTPRELRARFAHFFFRVRRA